uniref:Basic leucine zipper nuclear factor 1 n=1 Tax=Molossus molossus TaxID=27622 RepID=A0A7J8CPL6_MOLMO|nr:basic leucine zipper nuclear factor 1 [Molossus molossus]
MTTLENLETKVTLTSTPVRGAGDGMETEEPSKPVEVAPGAQPRKPQVLQSPRKKAVTSQSPGVLQLGKLPTEKAVEVEAMRIIVPKAAITHVVPNKTAKAKPVGRPTGELPGQSEGAAEAKSTLEKLQSSERRLLQDREGLSNQLRVQTEVNRELKKLLVASVGDDLPYHFERLAREKNQLILENEAVLRILAPVTCTESSADNPFSASSPTTLLATKKNIGRFHPYTRYEDITFNCCNNCQGELTVL